MQADVFEPRFYRKWVGCGRLAGFTVREDETDLAIKASLPLQEAARKLVIKYRGELLAYAEDHPRFVTSLGPIKAAGEAPEVARLMAAAAAAYRVGPMAAVAGAIAELVGRGLLCSMCEAGIEAPEVIVENGGDCFIKTGQPAVVSLYAGDESPFSEKLKLRIHTASGPRGVCTSSGTVGHSMSLGNADAIVAVAHSAALADAAATAIANSVKRPEDIDKALEKEKQQGDLLGLLIAVGEHLGAWGEIEIT